MHPIENILKTTMSELKEMVDVNTIVGDPFVSPSGCTIIPISRVSLGFVTGGGEYGSCAHGKEQQEQQHPFAGGTASGVTISPVAFMVADTENVKLLTVSHRNALDKLMENVPKIISEVKSAIESAACHCGEQQEQDEYDVHED